MVLTRDRIRDGWVQQMVGSVGDVRVLSADELAASRRACLAGIAPGSDVWVFGYGSLIWNPCFHYAERRVATARGWHRRFCLWSHLGRGTRERPGLMLGLERGGTCRGVAFRIAAADVDTELDIIWRREMVTASYRPTWVQLDTDIGRIRALAFTIDRSHDRYAGRLDDARIIEVLATACGPLGACCEYLFETTRHLEDLGIGDRLLRRLCHEVQRYQVEKLAELPEPAANAQPVA